MFSTYIADIIGLIATQHPEGNISHKIEFLSVCLAIFCHFDYTNKTKISSHTSSPPSSLLLQVKQDIEKEWNDDKTWFSFLICFVLLIGHNTSTRTRIIMPSS